ncbi:DNA gyrase inhibitor YacG [Novosphingobium guangzhouense]|uniref:DNA gyrase inhibitor YacG n=1 Tax=Novosphingobium guangzhouense TaxID=1850347 RepID=A0A2K2G1V7_9SPHN|nr:DNA gyrase inhibitor YacG [Novosphingobium guangzhouense]PNU04982.1 zinc-binding protein [Novosphingobium guangzhouense]
MTLSERKCPICRKPRVTEFTPFCSKRCRDRDLLQWLDDGYALPGQPHDPEDFAGHEKSNPQDD